MDPRLAQATPNAFSSSATSLEEKYGDVQILEWDGAHDRGNPQNWSSTRKWSVAAIALIGTLILPLNGTSITIAADDISAQFGVRDTSQFTNTYWMMASWSLGGGFMINFFLGLLEDFGVRTPSLILYAFYVLMLIPQAVAQNYATLVVTRFFSGGCVALLANTIASMIPDLWESDRDRSLPVSIYILNYIVGNTLGPPLFAAVLQFLGWRWIQYIQLIVFGAFYPLFILTTQETRPHVILSNRAKKLRKQTGKQIYTRDEIESPPVKDRLLKSMWRPSYLVFTEPVLFACTIWSAFSLGMVFLFTQSVEQVFSGLYGWTPYQCGYVQGAVVIGEVFGWLASLYGSRLWLQSAERNPEFPGQPIPEARLYVSILGSFFGISCGMFVYAWAAYSNFPWEVPAVGLVMVGFGIQTVVSAVADYVTDAYAASGFAGSAISAVAAGESIVAGLLPLASSSMYTNLGFHWASSLVGFLALALTLAPIIFVWKGRTLRERSPFMKSVRGKNSLTSDEKQ